MRTIDFSRAAGTLGLILVVVLAIGLVILLAINAASAGPISLLVGVFGATAIVLVFLRLDIGRLLSAIDVLGVGLPITGYLVVTALMGPTIGTPRFAEVGAQVIVVLLLALALDARFFRLQPDRDRLETGAILCTMLLLASGEFYAVRALLTNDFSHSEMVAGAITAGFIGVAVAAITGSARSKEERERRDSNPRPPA